MPDKAAADAYPITKWLIKYKEYVEDTSRFTCSFWKNVFKLWFFVAFSQAIEPWTSASMWYAAIESRFDQACVVQGLKCWS